VSIATIRGLSFPPKYNTAFSTLAVPSPTTSPYILSLKGFPLTTISSKISPLLTLRKDLHLYIHNSPNAISTLWTDYLSSHYDCNSEATLQAFIHTLTATGFALPTQFPAHPLGRVVPPQSIPLLMADFAAHMAKSQLATYHHPFPNTSHLHTLAPTGDADQFAVLAGKACHERRFFMTASGRMGLCPRSSQPGDTVAVLYGGSVPYVLREVQEGRWHFIGECYVEGYMFGEAEGLRGNDEAVEKLFDII
jgi:hypothetical protein